MDEECELDFDKNNHLADKKLKGKNYEANGEINLTETSKKTERVREKF